MKLRIVQLTDLHIGSPREKLFEADPRQQLNFVIAQLRSTTPDICVVTGDLCMRDPDKQVGLWIREQMEKLQIPYFVIGGNHDDSRMLAELFHPSEIKEKELYYCKRIHGHLIVFLDTSRGRCSKQQWNWLENIAQGLDEPMHIFMHHPPIYAGVPHMDNNHAFIDQDEFVALSQNFASPIHVYCGHYHVNRSLNLNHVNIQIAPSTLFQIDPYCNEFKLGSTQAGYNVIDIESNRVTVTTNWVSHE